MPRGGYRKGSGRFKEYTDPVEIRIRLERRDRDKIDLYCQKNGIGDRNEWLKKIILKYISK